MRKMLVFLLPLAVVTFSFGQQIPASQQTTQPDYLAKSKRQQTTGWVLLGGGAAMIATGLLIGDRDESSLDDAAVGAILAVAGATAVVVSIPFFLAADRNKRKAAGTTSFLQFQHDALLVQTIDVARFRPGVSLKISF